MGAVWETAGLLTMSEFSGVVAASLGATLPLLFIPSFRRLSWLSSLGCLCTSLITITQLACVALDPSRSHMRHQVPPPSPRPQQRSRKENVRDVWQCRECIMQLLGVTLSSLPFRKNVWHLRF